MRRALLLLLVLACSHKGYLRVHVTSATQLSNIVTLSGTITFDGVPHAFSLPHATPVEIPPEQTFAIEVPDGLTGLLFLHLDAIDSSGAGVASGDAEALVTDSDMTLTFGQTSDGGVRDGAARDGGRDAGLRDLAVPDGLVQDLAATLPCPNIMIAVDHTGSTSDPIPGAIPDAGTDTKLRAMVSAINTVAAEYGGRVPIGLTSFGSATTGMCGAGVIIGPEAAVGNSLAISSALGGLAPAGTGNNDVVLQQLAADTSFLARRPSYIIMITDNAPNCAGSGATGSDPTTTAAAATAASTLFSNGYPTYVVGISMVADPAALSTIAQAGGVPCAGATCSGQQYWPVTDAASLTTQLRNILDAVAASCN